MATLVDPSTGRSAITGPNGEAALLAGDGRIGSISGLVQGTDPLGRTVFYVPGQNIAPGNVAALQAYNQQAETERAQQQGQSDAARADADAAAGALRAGGLDALLPYADQIARGLLTWPQLQNMLYDPTTEPGKIVDTLYPEIQLRRKNGFDPISIQDIQNWRTQARQLMKAAGLPEGFYDQPSDFTKWIAGDVGLPELNDRIGLYKQAASAAPQETRDALKSLYGVDDNGIAAWYMDESRAVPLLEKQLQAAGTAGAAQRAGFGDLSAAEAERLAAVGVTGDSAVQAFGTLARAGELFAPLPGTSEDAFGRDQQLALISGDAAAAAEAQKRAATRTAETQGGGSFAASQRGLTGVGTAR